LGELERARNALAQAISERREALLDEGSDLSAFNLVEERAMLAERALGSMQDAVEFAHGRLKAAETALHGREKLAASLTANVPKIESALATADR
jgi:hypothetical protein